MVLNGSLFIILYRRFYVGVVPDEQFSEWFSRVSRTVYSLRGMEAVNREFPAA